MYSYSVIQGHTLLVLLLASLFAIVCSYAGIAWTAEHRILVALSERFAFFKNDLADPTLSLSPVKSSVPGVPLVTEGLQLPASPAVVGQHAASQSGCQAPKVADVARKKDAVFHLGETLALLIAFSAVIALCLAVAGFLLGEQ